LSQGSTTVPGHGGDNAWGGPGAACPPFNPGGLSQGLAKQSMTMLGHGGDNT